jgi:hypothetical protein
VCFASFGRNLFLTGTVPDANQPVISICLGAEERHSAESALTDRTCAHLDSSPMQAERIGEILHLKAKMGEKRLNSPGCKWRISCKSGVVGYAI